MKHIVIFLSIVLFLGGCANTKVDYNKLRNSKQVMSKSLSSLSTIKLENKKELILKLGDEQKEVILIDKQKVFAVKLQLTQMQKPFSLDVQTVSTNGFFAPKIFFLDISDKIVKTAGAKDLFFDRGYFKGTLFVNHNYQKIRSIVVTQDLNQLNKKYKINYVTAYDIPMAAGMYTFYYTNSSGDLKRTIENAYGGTVLLTLKVYKPTIVGKEK